MRHTDIERFLTTSEGFLMGQDDHASRVPLAVHLLVAEFKRAVSEGPEAMLTAPETMRDAQTTLANTFSRMLDDDPTLIVDLLVELRHGTKEDTVEYLAHTYAAWVLASYDVKAFKS
jgi:hypothetical protein